MGQSSLYRVLWVDDDPHILAAAGRMARGQEWTFTACSSFAEAREYLLREKFAVFITDQKLADGMGTDLLAEALTHRPATTRVLLSGLINIETIREAVNRCRVFRILSKPWDENVIHETIREAILRHAQLVDQKTLLREINNQNRELEELTFGLEEIVSERTSSIERKKSEAESNLAKLRELVRFVNSLAELSSMEELFMLLRREFRRHEGVNDPILAFSGADNKHHIVFAAGGEVVEREIEHHWPIPGGNAGSVIEYRQFFANELGRPLAQLVQFSLAVPRRFRDQLGSYGTPYLFIEHVLGGERVKDLQASVENLLQPLSIAFDRIMVERHMQHTAYQWATTFDALQDPLAIVGVDYKILRANRHFLLQRVSNFPHSGRSCFEAYFGSRSPCENCPLREATKSGSSVNSLLRIHDKTYEVSSYPIVFDPQQRATSVVNHYVDVTDSRALYVRLIQNEKMAAVGLLAGSIAHELNNPLTGIRNLVQIVLSEIPQSDPTHTDLLEVEKAAARCQKVIRDLLDFSSGQSHVRQRIHLSEVVNKTLPLLKTALRNFYQEIELLESGDVVEVEPQLLQQVIFNLLNNACQAMGDRGTLSVLSDIVSDAENHPWVRLRIRDSGPGISAHQLEKIFEPFYTTKAQGEGTGLGLSISRSIIESYGGQLIVSSEPPNGAEFTLLLRQASS